MLPFIYLFLLNKGKKNGLRGIRRLKTYNASRLKLPHTWSWIEIRLDSFILLCLDYHLAIRAATGVAIRITCHFLAGL